MSLVVRALTAADRHQSSRLGAEAFGGNPAPPEPEGTEPPPLVGTVFTGTFDGGELLARLAVHDLSSFFHGQVVPTAGIAGVTVGLEHRRRGLLGPLMRSAVAAAAEQGAVISTLFPTAPRIYRRYGYELISSITTVEIDTTALATIPPYEEGVTLRRATAADVDALLGCYLVWAQAQNGPLTRTGPRFTDPAEDFLDTTGTTMAVDSDGAVLGYCSWDRGTGYGRDIAIEVYDLVALTPGALTALARALAGFGSVAGKIQWRTSGFDELDLLIGAGQHTVTKEQPYMLRLLDVPTALSMLSAPAGSDFSVDLEVVGDDLGLTDGCYRITAADGAVHTVRTRRRTASPTFTPRGLALWWSGRMTLRNLRMAGLATGGVADDATFDALIAARPLQIRDYF
ncbi:GNAT family N-acetyltransferase [Propionibacteriaceae bacterium Y1685]